MSSCSAATTTRAWSSVSSGPLDRGATDVTCHLPRGDARGAAARLQHPLCRRRRGGDGARRCSACCAGGPPRTRPCGAGRSGDKRERARRAGSAPEDIRAVLDAHQVDIVIIALPHATTRHRRDPRRHRRRSGGHPLRARSVQSRLVRGGIEEFETLPSSITVSRRSTWIACSGGLRRGRRGRGAPRTLALMLAIAAAIKLSSRGPALYRQERMGPTGRFVFFPMVSIVFHAQVPFDGDGRGGGHRPPLGRCR